MRAVALCALVGLAVPAAAGEAPRVVPANETNILGSLERLLEELAPLTAGMQRDTLTKRGIALCTEAAQKLPGDPRPSLLLSQILSNTDPAHPEHCTPGYCERALIALQKAEHDDTRGIFAERIASERGIVDSRMGNFAAAVGDYDRALGYIESDRSPASLDDTWGQSVLWGNAAESEMALGHLSEAIRRYRRSLGTAEYGSLEWALGRWGLAVALDRDGQHAAASEGLKEALARDPTMEQLEDEGVFFEPAGDKLYYQALGYLVLGQEDDARSAWRRYLDVLPDARYAKAARAHLAALGAAPAHPHSIGAVQIDSPLLHDERIVGTPAFPTPVALGELQARATRSVQICWNRQLATHPSTAPPLTAIHLSVVFRFWWWGPVIPPIEVQGDDSLPGALQTCIERAAAHWRLPLGSDAVLNSAAALSILLTPPPS